MKHLFLKLSVITILLLSSVTPVWAQAVDKPGALDRLRTTVGLRPSYDITTDEEALTQYIAIIIGVILSLLGIIFVFLMVYSGYTWMTASGDEKKVEKAQQTIKVAIIGLIIISATYAIWQFLFKALLKG